MKTTKPLRGENLLKAAVNQILLHPETWNQSTWHSSCGTKHCIAGWCQLLGGYDIKKGEAMNDAKKALGISDGDAEFLFRSSCTIADAYYFAKNFNSAGFNRAGFNRAGEKLTPFDI